MTYNTSVRRLSTWVILMSVASLGFCQVRYSTADIRVPQYVIDATLRLSNVAIGRNLTLTGNLDGEQCRPLQVRRIVRESSIDFSLWYKVSTSDVTVTWVDDTTAGSVDEEPTQVNGNLWRSDFESSNQNNDGMVKVVFQCPKISHILHLNKSDSFATERDLIPFNDYFSSNQEIVYTPNPERFAAFEARVTSPVEVVTVFAHVYNPSTQKMLDSFQVGWETWPVSVYDRSPNNMPLVKNFRVETNEIHFSGLIEVNMTSPSSPGSLTHRVEVIKRLVLRPANQRKPFPVGFIGFDHHGLTQREDGSLVMPCRDASCEVYCDAYGNGLTRLRMYKSRQFLFNGHDVPIRDRFPSPSPYHRAMSTSANAQQAEEEEARFTCIADDNRGTEKNLTIMVSYTVPATIPTRLTERFYSNSRVKVTCKVQGRPVPSVRFALIYQHDYNLVEPTGQLFTRSNFQKSAYIMAPLYADPGTNSDRLRRVTCSADITSGPMPSHDHRSIEIGNRNYGRR